MAKIERAGVKFSATYNGTYLIPSSNLDEYEAMPRGEYMVTVTKARNPGHHRKMFKLLQLAYENQDIYDNFEDFFVEVKLKAGHYAEHITTKGKLVYVPKSIEFASMDQTEFAQFYNKVLTIVMEHFGYEGAIEFV